MPDSELFRNESTDLDLASEVSSDDPKEKSHHGVMHAIGQRRNANLILAALLFAATGLVLTTYFLLQQNEQIEFETAFTIFARETAVVAEMHAENVFGQLQSLATSVRSSSVNPDHHYPHEVTIPDFDLRAEEIANLTGIEMLMFVPFVPNQERKAFEEYQLLHQDWILEGYDYRGWNTSHLKTIPRTINPYPLPDGYNDTRRGYVDTGFMEEILENHTAVNKTLGCTVPVAQIGPRLNDTSVVMTDLFSHPVFKKEITASLEYDVPVISEVEDLEFLLNHIQPISGDAFNYSLPRSFTLDPVKAGFNKDSLTIGYMVGIIQWNAFVRNFFPENVNGVIVDIESDCGRNFIYVINGGRDDEWYLDASEGPNSPYKHLEQRFKFFWKEHPKGTSRHCHFDLLITPSQEFADEYLSNTPLLIAGAVLAFFAGAALIFILYDFFNYKQQQQIAKEKDRAEAVVTSLFPEKVGKQLMEEQGHSANDESEWQTDRQEQKSKPLADLFPSATIMFADIKGFTAWSSSRPPSDVFTLLETIYHAMDEIAKRRRVFKIETIGDCYVAVCGLPSPRENHAVVMARFAQNCLDKFRELVIMLDDDLPGTRVLELRTGLHSGPVTAGVLRGERARFQLFGDTVNTTARIESTGEGSKIHTSQQFADELIKWNKEHWLVPREDKVEAKGKGTLSTCWLLVRDMAETERRTSISSYSEQQTATETPPPSHEYDSRGPSEETAPPRPSFEMSALAQYQSFRASNNSLASQSNRVQVSFQPGVPPPIREDSLPGDSLPSDNLPETFQDELSV